jgi:hypothetical protein
LLVQSPRLLSPSQREYLGDFLRFCPEGHLLGQPDLPGCAIKPALLHRLRPHTSEEEPRSDKASSPWCNPRISAPARMAASAFVGVV